MEKKVDPTAANRQAIANFATSLLPASSPIAQSIEASKAEAKAKELEAKAELERAKAAEQIKKEQESMMSVGAPAAVPMAEPVREPAQLEQAPAETLAAPVAPSLMERGLASEVAAETKLGKQQSEVLANTQAELMAREQQAEQERKTIKERIDAQLADIEATQIEPKSFWDGKTTGQRITAGIGLFLASLTPQGAANAQKIISDEIERDLLSQKANLGKKQNTLAQLQQKLGSVDAAESAFRLKALQNVEMKIKANAEGAKGDFAKAKMQQALGQLEAAKAKAQQELLLKLADKSQKNEGLMVDSFGFVGQAKTPEEAKEFRKELASVETAKGGIAKLLQLAKKGSKASPADRATAETEASLIISSLRTSIVGPGAVNESEWALLRRIVANPMELFQLDSQTQASLGTLTSRLDKKLENFGTTIGVRRAPNPLDQFKRK